MFNITITHTIYRDDQPIEIEATGSFDSGWENGHQGIWLDDWTYTPIKVELTYDEKHRIKERLYEEAEDTSV